MSSASLPRPSLVGALGSPRVAEVDELGSVAIDDVAWDLAWWVGADDRWHVPAHEIAVRHQRVDSMPVVQTTMRVPGGDAVQRVYGVAGSGDPIVVDIENASGAPFVVAFVVRGARSVKTESGSVIVDNRTAIVTARPAARWAVERGRSTDVAVCSGAASDGPFPATRDRAGRVEAAFLHPVAHRTTLRVAIVTGPAFDALALAALPTADVAARGWRAHLERGMAVSLPDPRLSDVVASARAEALLVAGRRSSSGLDLAALEEWGFDDDAAAGWRQLSGRERRRAAQRSLEPAMWDEVCAAQQRGGSELLLALRSLLVHERDGIVTVISQLPDAWRGQPIDVHDAPTREGLVSFAVRWHGSRPALLWSVPDGVALRAPGLDAEWSTRESSGELLFGGAAGPLRAAP